MEKGRWKKAVIYLNQAETWPENLFSGEPYLPDNRITQFLRAYCFGMLKMEQSLKRHSLISHGTKILTGGPVMLATYLLPLH